MVFLKDMQHAKIYITVAITFSALELHCTVAVAIYYSLKVFVAQFHCLLLAT